MDILEPKIAESEPKKAQTESLKINIADRRPHKPSSKRDRLLLVSIVGALGIFFFVELYDNGWLGAGGLAKV